MTIKNLLETATLVESGDADTWTVRLISEGKGSSGIYPAETLETYKHAFDNVLSFENHPIGWDGPEARNFQQIVGRVVGETWTDTDERGKVGIYAKWSPDPDSKERLNRYKDNLGLSIYVEGEGHADEDGNFVVDTFNEHDAFRSVDVVIAAGRGGRFEEGALKKIYAQRRVENKSDVESSAREFKEKEIQEMDKEILDAVNALKTSVDALTSTQTAKAEETAQIAADEAAVKEKVEAITTNLDAVESAREGLLPSQVENLRAEAKAGVDVAPLIETAKAQKAEMEKDFETRLGESQATGRVKGSGSTVTAADLGKVFG